MTEPWLIFYHQGKELLAYTLRGTFPGERQDTIALLAAERGIDPAEITTKTENRRTGK